MCLGSVPFKISIDYNQGTSMVWLLSDEDPFELGIEGLIPSDVGIRKTNSSVGLCWEGYYKAPIESN